MEEKSGNIFTFHGDVLPRSEKEKLLNQKALAIWMTGLSGSGKSTIAKIVERKLHEAGFLCTLLDGDNLRDGLNRNLGFSHADRLENIRRVAELNKLMNNAGVITLNAFVSPTEDIRSMARNIIGDAFFEVYIDAPIAICEERDVKGLYKKARKGIIPEFTGISAPFEAPEQPDLKLETDNALPEESADRLITAIMDKIKWP